MGPLCWHCTFPFSFHFSSFIPSISSLRPTLLCVHTLVLTEHQSLPVTLYPFLPTHEYSSRAGNVIPCDTMATSLSFCRCISCSISFPFSKFKRLHLFHCFKQLIILHFQFIHSMQLFIFTYVKLLFWLILFPAQHSYQFHSFWIQYHWQVSVSVQAFQLITEFLLSLQIFTYSCQLDL